MVVALTLASCERQYDLTKNLVYDPSHEFGVFDYYQPGTAFFQRHEGD